MPVTSSNAATGAVVGTPRRQYVSINPFNNDFYSYTTSTEFTGGSFVTTGSLDRVSGANATNCPAGRVLRENGKKLFPEANPGVTTYLVGVYDSTTFLNGFIDPNARVFQPQSTDLPTYLPNPVDSANSGDTDFGPGVYTRGDVRAQGALSISGESYLWDDVHQYSDVYTSGKTDISGALFVNGDILTNGQVRNCNAPRAALSVGSGNSVLYTGNGPMFTYTGVDSTATILYVYSGFTGAASPTAGEQIYLQVTGSGTAASTITFASGTGTPGGGFFKTTGPVAGNAGTVMLSFISFNSTMTEVSRTGILDNA
jgi:hypothetical protein